jgi:hypothetical protein
MIQGIHRRYRGGKFYQASLMFAGLSRLSGLS